MLCLRENVYLNNNNNNSFKNLLVKIQSQKSFHQGSNKANKYREMKVLNR